jgi:hypothetical protein
VRPGRLRIPWRPVPFMVFSLASALQGEGILALSARSVNLGCPGRPRSLRRSIEVNECSGVMSSSDPRRGSSGFGIAKGFAYSHTCSLARGVATAPWISRGSVRQGKSYCPRLRRATLASLSTMRRPGPPGPHSRSCGRRSSSPNPGPWYEAGLLLEEMDFLTHEPQWSVRTRRALPPRRIDG